MLGRRTFCADVISTEEQSVLVEWALEMSPLLKANGPGRTFLKVPDLPFAPPEYETVRARIEALLNLPPETDPEPVFGRYLSVISEGGAVHPHLDPTPDNRRHLRCNLFLQLPDEGGLPIIARREIPVRERSILAFFPSDEWHSSQAVHGPYWRIICSFGYLTPLEYAIPTLQMVPDGDMAL
jgi:hypothetical protein